jgi:hypothetical protein
MRRTEAVWLLAGFALTITIGLRYQVGGDWNNYLEQFAYIPSWELVEVFGYVGDPGYTLLVWFAGRNDFGIWFVNTVCGGIFSYGLIAFARSQPRPWLALAVAVPYLIIVVAMGYTRQAAAIGFAMLGLVRLGQGAFVRFALCIALAAAFHKTATLLLPLAALSATKSRLWTALWSSAVFAILYSTLLEKELDNLIKNYAEARYQSEGAAIRVAMNALPAIVFLLNRRRFAIDRQEDKLWTYISVIALGAIVALVLTPSSTAVDRLALYGIPLQLFVWSRLPEVILRGRSAVIVFGCVSYSSLVLVTWLLFATHSTYWLPYQLYPLGSDPTYVYHVRQWNRL